MKKLINTVLLLFLIGTVSSCLKSGLDDLEAYNEAEITNLNSLAEKSPGLPNLGAPFKGIILAAVERSI